MKRMPCCPLHFAPDKGSQPLPRRSAPPFITSAPAWGAWRVPTPPPIAVLLRDCDDSLAFSFGEPAQTRHRLIDDWPPGRGRILLTWDNVASCGTHVSHSHARASEHNYSVHAPYSARPISTPPQHRLLPQPSLG
eukprot:gene11563-biopygen19896